MFRRYMMKNLLVLIAAASSVGCATLTSDAMTPVALSFGDGSSGECHLTNKRGNWTTDIPATVSVRRSDDSLQYQCETLDGRESVGSIASTVGAKIVASAVFIDLGITDAITDKHREYTPSFVIPVEARSGGTASAVGAGGEDVYSKLSSLDELREKGILTDEEFDTEKKKLLDAE